jgi:hypothetical protein
MPVRQYQMVILRHESRTTVRSFGPVSEYLIDPIEQIAEFGVRCLRIRGLGFVVRVQPAGWVRFSLVLGSEADISIQYVEGVTCAKLLP